MKHLIGKQLIKMVSAISEKHPHKVALGLWTQEEEKESSFIFGADYSNDTFTIRTTCFNPDCTKHDRNIPNFYTEDLEVWWYKWIGHYLKIKTKLNKRQLYRVFDKCLKSIK